jgi:hypothetical protein
MQKGANVGDKNRTFETKRAKIAQLGNMGSKLQFSQKYSFQI